MLGVLMLAAFSVMGRNEADRWETLKGRHVKVLYQENADFADAVLRRAERYYTSIVARLGFRRLDNFWLWERRATIQIYPTREAFVTQTGAPAWAAAKANYEARAIASYGSSREFLDARLPHEMAHLIFREYIGFKGEVPLWLDEGVAQWCEQGAREAQVLALRTWIPLETLTRLDIRTVNDPRQVHRFYLQAASVVRFMAEEYGRRKFAKFCRQLRDGKRLETALRFTYSRSMPTISSLEKQWVHWQAGRRE